MLQSGIEGFLSRGCICLLKCNRCWWMFFKKFEALYVLSIYGTSWWYNPVCVLCGKNALISQLLHWMFHCILCNCCVQRSKEYLFSVCWSHFSSCSLFQLKSHSLLVFCMKALLDLSCTIFRYSYRGGGTSVRYLRWRSFVLIRSHYVNLFCPLLQGSVNCLGAVISRGLITGTQDLFLPDG